MHIILVSNRMATARSITLSWRHLILASGLLLGSVLVLSTLFSYLTMRHAADVRLPFVQSMLRTAVDEDSQRAGATMKEKVDVLAVKLGEMQAKLMRLDSIGERLAGIAGFKPQELKAVEPKPDGRGGPLVTASTMTPAELQRAVDELALQLEAKSDVLSLIETQLLEDRLKKNLIPTSLPIEANWNASAYGWRHDPFTGERAMHEGVDFVAAAGTPIHAAAAGVVTAAERHPQYGNLVEIDHGKELSTRYAHASKLHVKVGQLVRRGQKIAEVGSTGRSTGPHLHFEVRVNGFAQNPSRFLKLAREAPRSLARVSRAR